MEGREPSAIELLVIVFQALPLALREEAFGRLAELRLEHQAAQETEAGRFLRSLTRAAELAGRLPTPDDYKDAARRLARRGEEIEPIGRVIRHYGSWRRAKEALDLSITTTAERIEARFRSRRLGKIWRYTDETLIETLRRCGDETGRAPLVGEFERWRARELELAHAEGNDWLHLPHPTVYRKRWGPTWPDVLARVFTGTQIAARLEQP